MSVTPSVPRGRPPALRRLLPVASLSCVLVSACAVNPVTGERELSFVSESREIAMGREADEQIVASMGVVDDPELAAYVSGIGREMAAVSERPDLPWTFRVIDDPTVNAFALPGGFIYVTRGMLTHLDSEAQLAGIFGHEIGHVTAKHSVNRMSRAQLAQLGLGVGMVLFPSLRDFGGIAGAGMQILFLKFGRDDEHQSDELGVRYMSRLGYEPAQLAGVFAMLERKSDEAGGALPSWASTHPAPEDRQERILALADSFPGADRVDRTALLARVDGLVFGRNPRQGFFADGVFHHPDMAFRFDIPRDWKGMNSDQAVQVVSPDEDAALVLRLSEAATPRAAAEDFMAQEGIVVTERREEPVHGLRAVWLSFTATIDGGRLEGRAVFPELHGRVYTLYGLSSTDIWSRRRSTVTVSLSSFREEEDPDVLGIRPDVVRVVSLDRSLPVREFMDRYGAMVDASTVTLINHAWATQRLPAGPVKSVTPR